MTLLNEENTATNGRHYDYERPLLSRHATLTMTKLSHTDLYNFRQDYTQATMTFTVGLYIFNRL